MKVGTVEHLLSALAGLGIDNVRVELDGPEVPIMDGSAAPFVLPDRRARACASRRSADSFLVIKKPVTVTDGDKEATLAPASRFRIDCTIDFKHPLISDQSFELELLDRCFSAGDLPRAHLRLPAGRGDAKKMGLARGGSLDNAIVVDEFSILNPDGLRFPDEFVRHKILDAIGRRVAVRPAGDWPPEGLQERARAQPQAGAEGARRPELHYEVVQGRPRGRRSGLELRLPELAGGLDLEPLVA